MSLRTKSSKARNHNKDTLPIEDFYHGVSRMLSQRKGKAKSKQLKIDVRISEDQILETVAAQTWPKRLSSLPENVEVDLTKAPIENWMDTIPERAPELKPRNPKRPSTSSSNSASSSILIDHEIPSSPESTTFGASWSQPSSSISPTPDSVYSPKMSDFAAAASKMQAVAQTQGEDVSPLSSRKPSHDHAQLSAAMMGIETSSLRSMFFAVSNGSNGRPRSLSSASSKSAIPPPLSFTSSPRQRPVSLMSKDSMSSFHSANEFAAAREEPEEDLLAKGKTAAITIIEIDDNSSESQKSVDTGIDEDYSIREESDVEDEVMQPPHTELEAYLQDEIVSDNPFSENMFQDVDVIAPPDGSLADVLLQVATSSPYASSESEAPDSEAEPDSPIGSNKADSIPNSPRGDALSERSSSLQDSGTTFSSMSIRECRRVRPARHYKMINGVIVEYEPWRVPGAFPQAGPKSRDSSASSSGRSFDRSGSFLRDGRNNRWTYAGPAMVPSQQQPPITVAA